MAGGTQPFLAGTEGVIVYLVTADHAYTLNRYLAEWAPELRPQIQPVFYEENPWDWLELEATYIFSDIERLTQAELTKASAYAKQLAANGFKVLNHPDHAPTRLSLQKILHAEGINPFRMFPVNQHPELRFPVFLRLANSHQGSIGDLIPTQAGLEQALSGLDRKIREADDLVVVEYCDTRDANGRYTKYSAMKIGDALVPRHAISSRQWMLKVPDIVDAASVEIENAFLEDFPQKAALEKIFELAKIDFGRIDFGLENGDIRVWEINSNPTFMPMKKGLSPLRAASIEKTNRWLMEALQSINAKADAAEQWQKIAGRHERKRRLWWLHRKLYRPKRA